MSLRVSKTNQNGAENYIKGWIATQQDAKLMEQSRAWFVVIVVHLIILHSSLNAV